MRLGTCLAISLGLIAAASSAAEFESQRAQNWHQWRGPDATGASADANPPVEWSEGKNIKWKVEIPGKGSATPIIWNDRIFLLTAVPTGPQPQPEVTEARPPAARGTPRGRGGRRGGRRGGFGGGPPPTTEYEFVVLCLDRTTGDTIWRRVANTEVPHEGHHQTNNFASGSAVTDGQHVFASFGSRGIYCYDLDGELIWEKDLGDMQTRNGFGEGGTPTLHGDTLVVPWDHEGQSFVVTLDANTGAERWRVDRDERTTWATPLVVEHDGRKQLVMNGSNRVRSYDLADGELIWECGGQAANPIPSPLTTNGIVYCMTGYRGFAVYAIPLSATGDISDSDMIPWHRTDSGPYVSSPVLYKGVIYHSKDRNSIVSSLDAATGEPRINQKRLADIREIYASPVAAADRVYFTGREGTTVVISHSNELDVLATNKLDEGIDASPALVGNELYLRGEKHLYCIAEGS